MDEIGALARNMNVYVSYPKENIDFEAEYIKQVELEFAYEVDELLEKYGLSHLKVN